jgi:hypothetical protein
MHADRPRGRPARRTSPSRVAYTGAVIVTRHEHRQELGDDPFKAERLNELRRSR